MIYKALSIDDIAEKCSASFKKYGVRMAAVFGSCARGEMQRGSDVDLLIDIGPLTSGLIFVDLKGSLENALRRKVDLISFNSLEFSNMRNEIMTNSKVIYEKGQ